MDLKNDRIGARKRNLGLLAVLALVGTLLVPLAVVNSTASAGEFDCQIDVCEPICETTQGTRDQIPCEEERENYCNVYYDVQVGNGDGQGVCCPDGSIGRWQWGGYAGQNLYWCDAPPEEPPATAEPTPEPTEEPAVSPTAAPKKAAPKAAPAAKPVFTG